VVLAYNEEATITPGTLASPLRSSILLQKLTEREYLCILML